MSLYPQSASNISSPSQPPNNNLNEPLHRAADKSLMSHSTNKRPYTEFCDDNDAQPAVQGGRAGHMNNHTLEKEQPRVQETLDLENSDSVSTSHSNTGTYTESRETAEQGMTKALKMNFQISMLIVTRCKCKYSYGYSISGNKTFDPANILLQYQRARKICVSYVLNLSCLIYPPSTSSRLD